MSFELIRSSKPPAKPADVPLRIYSNPICPFAHRARLIAAAKGIKHEIVEVSLNKQQPEWYLELNPFALVPVIEHNGHTLRESAVVFDYIDEAIGDQKLWPADPYKKAQGQIILKDFGDMFTPNFYKYYRNAQDENSTATLLKFLKSVETVIEQYGGPFIMGNQLSAIDLLIWPWFERLAMAYALAPDAKETFSEKNVPLIVKWIQALEGTDAVKKTAVPAEGYAAFAAALKANPGTHDYSLLKIPNLKVYAK